MGSSYIETIVCPHCDTPFKADVEIDQTDYETPYAIIYPIRHKQQSFFEFAQDIVVVRRMPSYYENGNPTHDEVVGTEAIADLIKEYQEKIKEGRLVK